MGLLTRLFGKIRPRRSTSYGGFDWGEWIGSRTRAGLTVTTQTALQFSAVFSAVRILSEDVASLPLLVYRRIADGGKERRQSHPLYRLLHDAPNEEMTAFDFWSAIMSSVLLYGNAYAEIETSGTNIIGLWPVNSSRITPKRTKTDELYYQVRNFETGETTNVTPDILLHIKGLSLDGVVGLSIIAYARESIAFGMQAERFGSAFFGNGGAPAAVMEVPGDVQDDQVKMMQDAFYRSHGGPDNAHRLLIASGGTKYSPLSIPQKDAQFLESRKFQINEIARWFRIPPHMLGDLERATFTNIEHQGLEYVRNSLMGWLRRIEMELNRKLFGDAATFAEFKVEGMLRGDLQSRYNAYKVGVENGWLNRNEVREMENMNRVEGLDDYLQPLNMAVVGEEPQPEPGAEPMPEPEPMPMEPPKDDENGDRSGATTTETTGNPAYIRAFTRVFRIEADRLVTKEVLAVRREIAKRSSDNDAAGMLEWMRTWYAKHEEMARETIGEAAASWAIATGSDVDSNGIAHRYALAGHEELLGIMRAGGPDTWGLLNVRMGQWERHRADRVANEEIWQWLRTSNAA